jgi:hypothetical protein
MDFAIRHFTESVEAPCAVDAAAAASAPAPKGAWTSVPSSVKEPASSSNPLPAVFFQIAFSTPKSGWTDEHRIIALAFLLTCQPTADKPRRPQAKFGRKSAVFGLASQEHVIAATLTPLIIFGETLPFATNVKPPPPPATKVKVVDLPIGYTEAIVRQAASRFGEVRYVSKYVLRGPDRTILCDLDSCAVFFEPNSTPVRYFEVMGSKCPVWDRRLTTKPYERPPTRKTRAPRPSAPSVSSAVATSSADSTSSVATSVATSAVATSALTSSEPTTSTAYTSSAVDSASSSFAPADLAPSADDNDNFIDASALNRHQRKRSLSPSGRTSPDGQPPPPPPMD